jgi:UPF0716 family protein affecting phage T7 exclusion
MARFLTLAFLALLAVAEVAAVLALVDTFGGPVALMLLLLDVVAGLAVIRWGARSLPPARGWRIAAGVFVALPGLVLDLVGLALLVPPIQRWVSGHVLRGTEAAMRKRGVSVITVTDASGAQRTTVVPGDVIPGQVVEGDSTPADSSESSGVNATDRAGSEPEPGPRVVRGEIAGPND